MPLFNVTLKENAPAEELAKAKQTYKDNGGEIKHEFTLIKGFTVEVPADKVDILSTNDHVYVESDGEVLEDHGRIPFDDSSSNMEGFDNKGLSDMLGTKRPRPQKKDC